MQNNIIIKSTKNFETISFRLVFPFEETEKDIAKIRLLPQMLHYMNAKYPTEEAFKKAKLANYILGFEAQYAILGTSGFIIFNLATVDPHIIKDNNLDNIIAFLEECIYHPKIIDKGFDSFELEREKEIIKKNIAHKNKHLAGYLDHKIPPLVDNVGIYQRGLYNHLEQLDEVTPQNLYKYYQKIIGTKAPYIFVIGNVNKSQLLPILSKYFTKGKPLAISQKHYDCFLKPFRSTPQFIEEEKDFQESAVSLVFKFKDICFKDKVAISMLRRLLSSEVSNLLFNKLRSEEGLVYTVDTINSSRYGLFEIIAYTDRDKLDLAKDKIFECLEDLKKEEIVAPLLKDIIDDYVIARNESKDYKGYILDEIMDEYFETILKEKERLKLIKNCQASDIKTIVERMQLDTCLYVKEKNHE